MLTTPLLFLSQQPTRNRPPPTVQPLGSPGPPPRPIDPNRVEYLFLSQQPTQNAPPQTVQPLGSPGLHLDRSIEIGSIGFFLGCTQVARRRTPPTIQPPSLHLPPHRPTDQNLVD
ncbi:hypothetical protein PGT21_006498 [Puccinia graminis f. sp. tritici]|uniref:Uncharacterized protein n=1 Tax=Puccinia graminis f. sp. tritici TaxID=56615 RepID=A0A5B0MNB9_PUCGR|nr:hypothetical protein PGT21_006498 [Puccinia graminis f. sp. tritici]